MQIRLVIVCLLYAFGSFAQSANKSIQTGNDKYKQNDYSAAENFYKQGLQKDSTSQAGNYNLGNAYYQQKKYDESLKQYESIAENTKDPSLRADAYHNLGNSYLQQNDYEKSIDAYKQALKANPADADTKYNLAYAQAKLKKQQQQQQNKDDKNKQDNKDQQNKNQNDKNKQDQNKQNQQNKNPDDKNKKEQNEQNKDQQPEKKQFSKDELERIMQALNNEDKKTQDKLNKQKQETVKVKVEKDW